MCAQPQFFSKNIQQNDFKWLQSRTLHYIRQDYMGNVNKPAKISKSD